MIYGSIDELSEVSDRSFKIGRLVAVSEFTKALIRHGSFKEYRFYCANMSSLQSARDRLEASFKPSELDRVILTLMPNFHEDLANIPFSAIHNSGGWTVLANLASIRNRMASSPFPVTSLIHSLNETHAYLKALKLAVSDVRNYDAIICSSEAGKKAVQSFFQTVQENLPKLDLKFRGEIAKIPLAVDTDFFQPQDRGACRKKLGLPQDATILLHLGRLSAHDKSDPAPLFYLFNKLCKQRPKQNLRLLLAGGADPANVKYFEDLCKEIGIADKVIFRPNFEDEEKPLLLGSCDIFVSLIDSLQETFGISAVEAMASGRTVVLSDFDGYKELVEHGRSGFTVPTYWGPADGFLNGISSVVNSKVYQLFLSQSIVVDIGILEKTLGDLIDHPEKRKQIEPAARQRAVEKFSWKVVIGQYEQLWKELGARAQKETTLPSESKPDPLAVDYYKSFSHYPSKIVDANWKVTLTDFGREMIKGAGLPAIYADIGILISVEWLKIILEKIVKTPATVGTLIQLAEEKSGAPHEHLLYHVLWLAKYDIVALEPA